MEKRKEYLEYMESNDYVSLGKMFKELQLEEMQRVSDIEQMIQ
jgi:hypothetical protein